MTKKNGFGESRQQKYVSREDHQYFATVERERVQLGKSGRLVIPARMRKALKIGEGDALIARVENGELIVVPHVTAIAKAQETLKHLRKSGERIVDDFIADRQKDQQRSDERFDKLHKEGMGVKKAQR